MEIVVHSKNCLFQ